MRGVARELETHRDRALFALLVYTGARISEALDLDVADVRRPGPELVIRRQITFQRGKTKGQRTGRVVDIHPDLAASLRRHLATENRADGPLFLSREGARLSRVQAWRRLRAAFTAAGLEADRVSPHSFRKTFAHRLAEGGVGLPIIQDLLGHADIRDTAEYLRIDPDLSAAAVANLPDEGIGLP